jgi:hypothetical protein
VFEHILSYDLESLHVGKHLAKLFYLIVAYYSCVEVERSDRRINSINAGSWLIMIKLIIIFVIKDRTLIQLIFSDTNGLQVDKIVNQGLDLVRVATDILLVFAC